MKAKALNADQKLTREEKNAIKLFASKRKLDLFPFADTSKVTMTKLVAKPPLVGGLYFELTYQVNTGRMTSQISCSSYSAGVTLMRKSMKLKDGVPGFLRECDLLANAWELFLKAASTAAGCFTNI